MLWKAMDTEETASISEHAAAETYGFRRLG
jgi:hypothetical protein